MFGTWASLSNLVVYFSNPHIWYISRKDGDTTSLLLLKHLKQWQTESDRLNAILTRCTNLRSIYIAEISAAPNLSEAWMAIGETLECIRISSLTHTKVLLLINQHCRAVKQLFIEEPENKKRMSL